MMISMLTCKTFFLVSFRFNNNEQVESLASRETFLSKFFIFILLTCCPSVGADDIDCRPIDIQLYTWSGPGFQSGECWYQGHRLSHGTTWGRMDVPGSPYCLCEQGQVRIFYSQRSSKLADALTLFNSKNDLGSPTSHDLFKWPIDDFPRQRQRFVICSFDRLGKRIRSRDGCVTCKCSPHGHWLCRRTRTRVPERCSLDQSMDSCLLMEYLINSQLTHNYSRYIEIPRRTSWFDKDRCTRCLCSSDGRLTCQHLDRTSSRSCILQKTRPFPLTYYFPDGSQWMTPKDDQCRSCRCEQGERRCVDCENSILNINIDTKQRNLTTLKIGHLSFGVRPCLVELDRHSHRLIYPGQKTWLDDRCYFCSHEKSELIRC